MSKIKKLEWISVIFVVLFLFVALPQSQSANETTTVPLTATTVVDVAETESPYTLTFKLAAVALHRENNKSQNLFKYYDDGGDISTGDLDLGWAPGMDVSIMLKNKIFGVELRYLGLHQWSEDKTKPGYTYTDFGPEGYYEGEGIVTGKFKSRLHNVELNLHWRPCACAENGNDRFNLLVGFRWLRLTDRLYGYDLGEEEDYWPGVWDYYGYYSISRKLSCRNQFWGGQVGAEGLLFGKRDQGFSIDGVVKAGVYANKIKNKLREYQEGWSNLYGDYFSSSSENWNRTKTSFLSELGLNANYAFTKDIAMTVGYQFLYVNKVAVPVNDWASTQSVIFHGGRMGLNIAF
jgi:hypothetical protein